MEISVEITPEILQCVKTSGLSQVKPACEILAKKLQAEYEEELSAIKEMDESLKSAIIATKNGDVVCQSFDEIVKEAREEIAKGRL